jgi:hypothetical protein
MRHTNAASAAQLLRTVASCNCASAGFDKPCTWTKSLNGKGLAPDKGTRSRGAARNLRREDTVKRLP